MILTTTDGAETPLYINGRNVIAVEAHENDTCIVWTAIGGFHVLETPTYVAAFLESGVGTPDSRLPARFGDGSGGGSAAGPLLPTHPLHARKAPK